MSFKRKFLRNAMRDQIKERQRAWRKGKCDHPTHQIKYKVSKRIKKER